MNEEEQFALMVEGKSMPQVIHKDINEAMNEAVSLSRKEQKTCYILKIIGRAELKDVKLIMYE